MLDGNTPFDDPSATGLTIAGKRRSGGSGSCPSSSRPTRRPHAGLLHDTSWRAARRASAPCRWDRTGVGTPAAARAATGREPRGSDHVLILGDVEHHVDPDASSVLGKLVLASRSMTTCPATRAPTGSTAIVGGASYSASSSWTHPADGESRLRLKASPTRNDRNIRWT